MTESFRSFFGEVEALVLKEPLAETLGAFQPGAGAAGTVSFAFGDLVKAAGHACPTMAGAWLSTRAAPSTGFKGLGPLFKRRDLLRYVPDSPDPSALCFEFRRIDTGAAVLVRFSPRLVPFPQEKGRRMGELMEKVVWDAAGLEERAEFQELWMGKVRAMLVDRTGIQTWLTVEDRRV
jgi:hypothetical protein